MGQHAAAVESCHNTLTELQAAETQPCDEARVCTTDQEAPRASRTAMHEVAFCEHHHMCTPIHQCHSDEAEVFQASRPMPKRRWSHQAGVHSCRAIAVTGLMMAALTPPRTPILHAALIACDGVDVSALLQSLLHAQTTRTGAARRQAVI